MKMDISILRIKDSIRRRGENTPSFDIEKVVERLEGVQECAAIGVKSEVPGGEDEIKICVVIQEGKSMPPEIIYEYCRRKLPPFMVPRYIEIMKTLPKTPTEKVQKSVLRKAGVGEGTWDAVRETISTKKPAIGERLRRDPNLGKTFRE